MDKWHDKIRRTETELTRWHKAGKKVVAKYRGREYADTNVQAAEFNLWWSSSYMFVATAFPEMPYPEVIRTFRDNNDEQARRLAEILEAALQFQVAPRPGYDIEDVMQSAVLDYRNAGLGMVRLRYKPYFETVQEPKPLMVEEKLLPGGDVKTVAKDEKGKEIDEYEIGPDGPYVVDERERVYYEEIGCEIVPWYRFGWDVDAPEWSQVQYTWIKHQMTEEDLKRNFPKAKAQRIIDECGFSGKVGVDEQTKPIKQRITIYELFDKEARKVRYICPELDGTDNEFYTLDDPYKLTGFFPHPPPLWINTTNDKLIPVPIYVLAQDLYDDLDEVHRRISNLTEQLKVRGVFDGSQGEELASLLTKDDGYLLNVSNYAGFRDKGGMRGIMDFVPLDEIYGALQTLMHARTALINQIQEVTGDSDIVRGNTKASETAAAQKIKAEYTSLRNNKHIRRIQRFIRDVYALMGEFIAEHFSAETLSQITGKEVTEEDMQILRSDIRRQYKIQVDVDALLDGREQWEQQSRIQFMQSLQGFMQGLPALQQAGMPPQLWGDLLLFVVRAYKKGRKLERNIEDWLESLQQVPPAGQGPTAVPGVPPPGVAGGAGG